MPVKKLQEAGDKRKPKKQLGTADPPSEVEIGAWADDQNVRAYYYDDAHGYEVYVPEEDDDSQVHTEKKT